MLVRFSELLAEASSRQSALGAFTCYNLEQALGVLAAAEECERGVVILVSEKSFTGHQGGLLLSALVAVARQARTPTCVQLDHVRELEPIRAAFELGAGAVMADGSRLSIAENIDLVRAAVAAGAPSAGEVEAELGGIEGNEDVAAAMAAGALTDPEEAASLAERSGAACLAVSIGNVHGVYREPPALDWRRLELIRERVASALSLHGASGLSDDDLRTAITLGVAKVNVNTELRERYLEVTAERISDVRDGARLLELNVVQVDAIARAVQAKLMILDAD